MKKNLLVAASRNPVRRARLKRQTATVIDLSTVTCKQLFQMKPEQISLVLAWMQANYAGENDPPRIELDKMSADKAKLADYCAKQPNDSLIDAGDELFAQ